ncbi:M81 family metallopeptidase [soil metagenome]
MNSAALSGSSAPLRVAIAGISHESNTYAVEASGLTDVSWFDRYRGAQIVDRYRDTATYIGGMLDALDDLGAVALPIFFAIGEPSGTITADAYAQLSEELLATLRGTLPVDAVALELHGAGVTEATDDLEGQLLAAVRELVGSSVPIVATLDLHANVTQRMAEHADVLLGVHLNPHTDMRERGSEAVGLLPVLVAGVRRPVTHVEALPMLLPLTTTDTGPAAVINARCAQVEQRDGVIDCTFFHGFPYADGLDVGARVVCTVDDDVDTAAAFAREVAADVWQRREEFRPTGLSPAEAVAAALEITEGPVVINDTADNPGGGTMGDDVQLLAAMLDAGVGNACFGFICDAESVAAAHTAGVGATVALELGGKSDRRARSPLSVDAYVKGLTDGRFRLSFYAPGLEVDLGRSARLQIDGIDVIVVSRVQQTFDPEVFLLHGVDVTRCRIVALKSSHHFRAGFRRLATAIITADSDSGLTTQRIERLSRRIGPTAVWPVDLAAHYTGVGLVAPPGSAIT